MNKMMNTDDMISMILLLPNAEAREVETFFYDYIQNNLADYQQLPLFLHDIKKIDDYGFAYKNIALTSLPDSITEIGYLAFCGCENLALTSLPDGVTKIGGYAFASCKKLTSFSLPNTITTIEHCAFRNCQNLTLGPLPSSIIYIGNDAFGSCFNLTSITFEGTPTSISSNAFDAYVETINVPWAEGEVANAPWGAANATINYNYTET